MKDNYSSEFRLKTLEKLINKNLTISPQWSNQRCCEEYRYKSNKEISDLFKKSLSKFAFKNNSTKNGTTAQDGLPPFTIFKNETLGRHLITIRNIKAGEVLLVERSIVSGPIVHFPYENDILLCVHCYCEARTYLCPQCGFFLCRRDICRKLHISSVECQYLSKLNLVQDQMHIHNLEKKDFKPTFQHLPRKEWKERCQTVSEAYLKFIEDQKDKVLRYYPALPTLKTICLMDKSKTVERIILSLQGDVKIASRRYKINQKHIVDVIKLMEIPLSEDILHRIAAVWDTNAFQSAERERKIQVIFPLSSFFTHSCRPNCENFIVNGSHTMIVRAVESIPKNSILTINYADPLWPTYIRRNHLNVSKNFMCKCERCEDCTEYGTFMGHVKCDRCDQVTLSTSDNNFNILICSNCKAETKYSKILATEATICNLLSSIDILDLEDYENITSKISAAHGKQFHDGHHILWKMRYSLVVDHARPNLSDIDYGKLQKVTSLIFDLYKFCSSVLPTFSKKKACVAKEMLRYCEELERRKKPFLNEKDVKIIEEVSSLPLNW